MDDNDKAGVAEGGVREAILMNDNENENGLVI